MYMRCINLTIIVTQYVIGKNSEGQVYLLWIVCLSSCLQIHQQLWLGCHFWCLSLYCQIRGPYMNGFPSLALNFKLQLQWGLSYMNWKCIYIDCWHGQWRVGYLSKDNKEGSMIIEATLISCTYCYICTRPIL